MRPAGLVSMSRDTLELGAGMLRMNTAASDEADLEMQIQACMYACSVFVVLIITQFHAISLDRKRWNVFVGFRPSFLVNRRGVWMRHHRDHSHLVGFLECNVLFPHA